MNQNFSLGQELLLWFEFVVLCLSLPVLEFLICISYFALLSFPSPLIVCPALIDFTWSSLTSPSFFLCASLCLWQLVVCVT